MGLRTSSRYDMTEVYKVYHNVGPVYMENLFNKADQFSNTRCVKPLEQPSFNTIMLQFFYIPKRKTVESFRSCF